MNLRLRSIARISLVWLACWVLASTDLRAEADAESDGLEEIRQRLEQQAAEIHALRRQLNEQARPAPLPPVSADDPSAGEETDDGAVVPASMLQEEAPGVRRPNVPSSLPKTKKDEFPTAKITGFTQLDDANYSQTPHNRATVGDAQNGVGFRRVRLGTYGKAAEFTNYLIEMDFATAGRPSFFDVYGEQTNLPWLGSVRIGQYVQPFSVDAMSGFRNLPFLERSLPFLAFVPFRRVGIEAYNSSEDQRFNLAYSCFKTGGFNNAPLGDDRYATDLGNVGGYSFGARATYLLYYDPLATDRYLWHVGGAFDYARLGENNAPGSGGASGGGGPSPFYQSKVLPEFGVLGSSENSQSFGPTAGASGTPNFIDSGKYAAKSFELYGVETVAQAGAQLSVGVDGDRGQQRRRPHLL